MNPLKKLLTKISQLLRTFFRIAPGVMCWTFVLVLPIGYYPDNPDSADYILGLHGGTGQIASVIRGCDGNTLHSESSSFKDFSTELYMPVPLWRRVSTFAGIRLGHFKSNYGVAVSSYDGTYDIYGYPDRTYGRGPDQEIDFWYYNPNINFEAKKVGLGFGIVFGDKYLGLSRDKPESGEIGNLKISFHARFGRRDKGHFLLSYRENTPVMSAGGPFEIGIGYPAGNSSQLFTGFAGGCFYDRVGLVQQGRFKLGKSIYWDITLRLGQAGSKSENAISTGFIFNFGKSL